MKEFTRILIDHLKTLDSHSELLFVLAISVYITLALALLTYSGVVLFGDNENSLRAYRFKKLGVGDLKKPK